MNLFLLQAIYILGVIAVLPIAPFLYLQGKRVRRKVGILPDAQGEKNGRFGAAKEIVKLLVLGESTVAGLGARTHETALAGQFAKFLSGKINKSVAWTAIGKNGVTAKRALIELIPQIPDEKYDYILLGLGGNDVLKLSSPFKWRRDMTELLNVMRKKNQAAVIFVTNAPAVHLSPVLPQPIKFILGNLSAMHDKNSQGFMSKMKNVCYFHRPDKITVGFFADGIHPSEQGYTDWSERMIEFFSQKYQW